MEELREGVVSFLMKHAVIRGGEESILSGSGKPLQWLLDTRVALLHPDMSFAISALFWAYLKDIFPFQMCCVEMTGIPLMTGVQGYALRDGYPVNGFIVRKEHKATGRRRLIEGTVNDLPIVFLDDIVNSGDSIQRALVALSVHDKRITHVVALVDFGTRAIGEQLLREGIHLKSLLQLEELGVSRALTSRIETHSRQIFQELWRVSPCANESFDVVPKSSPALDGNLIYFGTDSGHFYAINTLDGKVEWTFKVHGAGPKGIRSSPHIVGDLVCFGSYDGVLYALDKRTGEPRWQFTDADWIGSSPCYACTGNRLFVGLEYALPGKRGSLVAVDIWSGSRLWEFSIEGLVHSSPVFLPDLACVAIGSNAGLIYCLDADNGTLKWSAETGGAIKARVSYDQERRLVIGGSFDGNVYAWDAGTGRLVWTARTGAAIYSEPLIVSNTLYISSTDKHFYAFDAATGEELSRFYADAKLFCSPAFHRGHIYFGSTGGMLYEFDPCLKAVTGSHFVGDRLTNKVAYDSSAGCFYVVTLSGDLIAYSRR